MTRSKLKFAYITNDMNRKSSFNKRKKGLFKKVDELSTLCGIDACAIVFGENDSNAEVWPSNLGAQRVLSKFGNMTEFQQSNKMETLESFTRERIKKAQEKAKQLKKENREKEMTLIMYKWLVGEGPNADDMSMSEINEIRSLVDAKIKEVVSRMEILEEERQKKAQAMSSNNGMHNTTTNGRNGSNETVNYQWSSLAQILAGPSNPNST